MHGDFNYLGIDVCMHLKEDENMFLYLKLCWSILNYLEGEIKGFNKRKFLKYCQF